ncbi:MAG TPA: acetate/propionate family kinase [Vicinamibacteria bacterium]|nr:acetate/propionate family kinase [Vicinamibacteria bacterium]
MKILIANIGSTSFKYRLLETEGEVALAQGKVERIGRGGCPDHDTAIRQALDDVVGPGRPLAAVSDLAAVGFKAVHAGSLGGVRIVDDAVLAAMEEFAFVAPAHNPPYLAAMRAFRRLAPSLPLVALFETAFFDALDEATTTYAIPYEWTRMGVRRYGFHGASHRAASERAQALLGRTDLRHVSCHLGGSSSVAAIRSGVAVDTSFGLSPQSGLPQNNRVGDMDAFAALFVMKKLGLDADGMARLLANESGLAGISGGSGDVRDLEDAAAKGNARARLALDVFVQAVRHYLGAFLVRLGGLDALSFSGGIGENSAAVRAAVCAGLSELGIRLDPERNAAVRGESVLSPDGARVTILLVPADEERIVARAVARVVGAGRSGPGS